jgi:glycosyltransferase involved in cell wall biosynthesis
MSSDRARQRRTRSIVFLHENQQQMGGGERVLLHVAGVAASTAKVYFAQLFGASTLAPEFAARFSGVAHFDFPLALSIRSVPRLLTELRALRRYLRRLEDPACIAFSYPAAFRMALAFPGNGPRLLWCCTFPPGAARRRVVTVRMIAMTGALAVCSNRFMADNLAGVGFPRGRIRVVHNGIDVEQFAGVERDVATERALRSRLGLPDADLLVACVARIDPVKNHIVLLHALKICAREGIRIGLVCVGDADTRHRHYAQALRAEARALEVESQVHWAGWQEDVAPWLHAADACVLASHAEGGTPLALLEAGAAGLPLLATRVGTAEVVIPGRTGLLFDADDADGCAAVMLHLARNEADRRRLGVEAQRHVRANFGLERLTEEWREVIARLAEAKTTSETTA